VGNVPFPKILFLERNKNVFLEKFTRKERK